MKDFNIYFKSKSYTDIFQYLDKLVESNNYLYLVKRVRKPEIKSNTSSSLLPNYYWNYQVDISIRRLRITNELLTVTKKNYSGLPTSITNYLWSKGEEFNQIRERLINRDVKGLILDIDRFDIGLFNDSVIKGN
jgi:hypothetical protein